MDKELAQLKDVPIRWCTDVPGINSWGEVDPTTERLAIMGGIKDYSPLMGLRDLRHLWVSSANPQQLAQISGITWLHSLNISWLRSVSDLTPIQQLTDLIGLSIEGSFKDTSLEPIGEMRSLRKLSLCALTSTSINGGKAIVESFVPLSKLTNLIHLRIISVKPREDGLFPIARIRSLRQLDVSNAFSVEELAYLAGSLPDAVGWFQEPYQKIEKGAEYFICGKCKLQTKVMLIGRSRPQFLCTACDAKRLRTHVEKYEDIRRRAMAAESRTSEAEHTYHP